MSTAIYIGGRIGDIISILPCARHIAHRDGGKCAVMVSTQFSDVLDGCLYVEPLIYERHFTDVVGALSQFAKVPNGYVYADGQNAPRHFDRLLIGKINERTVGSTAQCEHFNQEQWRQLGCLELWDSLPLVFDRRSPEREAALLQHCWPIGLGKPFGLYNFSGKSSPLPEGLAWLKRNRDLIQPGMEWIDLSQIKSERIYDMLALYEKAAVVVTGDTATLHLAAASDVPCVNFVADKPSVWHGSAPRNNAVLTLRYDEMRDLTAPLELRRRFFHEKC